jgi:hypothetical protein
MVVHSEGAGSVEICVAGNKTNPYLKRIFNHLAPEFSFKF